MNVRQLHRKRMAWTVLLVLLLNVAGLTKAFAQEQFEADNLLYTIISTNPPTVSLDGHVDGTSASDELVIPETVENGSITYTVTAISDNAFANYTDMYGDIDIPNTVLTIGSHAFDNAGFDGLLTIGTSVTTIGSYAFANLGSTGGDLHIPNSVTQIGDHAFYQSYFDGTFALSNAVVSIGEYAFYGCQYMTASPLAFPNTLSMLGDYAFYHYAGLAGRLTLSTTLTSIGAHAFDGCGFTQLNFGSTTSSQLQSIGDCAFYNCSSMTGNLAFPLSIQSVGQYAFANCGFTGNLNLRNMKTIGAYAFSNVPFNSNGLTIPASVTEIGAGAFSGCFQGGTLTINANLTSVPNYAFSYCGFTGSLNIPSTVTSIGESAFYGTHFSGLLNIPEGVTSIGSYAFYDCTGFTGSLTINENIASIGEGAFYGCTGFTTLNYNAINCSLPASYWDGWLSGCSAMTSLNIGENVQIIPDYAFRGNNVTFTGELVIPGSVTMIGNGAFVNNNFSSITVLPETPPTLGEYVFFEYGSLNIPVYVPCGFGETYSSQAWGGFTQFYELCSGTVTVVAEPVEGGSVTGGGFFESGASCTVTATANAGYVFANWTKNGMLASTNAEYTFQIAGDMTLVAHFVPEGNIVFADANVKSICVSHWDINGDGELSYVEAASVTDLGSYFRYNEAITSFDELQYFIGLSSIGNYAFSDCSGLTSFVLPNTVTTISERAFYYCTSLNSVTIGENVTNIGHYAFAGCSNLTTLNYNAINSNASNAYMDYGWLEYCPNLHTLNIGENVQVIPDNAFYGGWSDLCFTGDLVIPNSVTTIGENAFRNNSFSSIACLLDIPPTLGENAFQNISQSIPVYVPCDAVEAYSNVTWGGFNNFIGLCSGTITVVANPVEGGTVTGGGFYESGTTCTVTATANEGFVFANWTKDGVIASTNTDYTFQVAGNMTLVAHFVADGNIVFADANVKNICVEHWDTNGDGELSYVEAASVTDLSSYFRYNSDLTSFDELQYFIGLSSIPYNAFHSCSNLTSVVLPESITVIGEQAFQYCNSLSGTLVIPNSVTTIGFRAFEDCYGYTGNLVIPNSVTSIAGEAFKNCTGFNGILTIGENVTSIGAGAFKDCSNLSGNFVLPNSVTSIGSEAFQNCASFNGILIIGEGVTSIENSTFSGCSGFTSVVLPNSLTSIGTYAFNGCSGLSGGLIIPNSVTTIGERAFRNCNGFTTLTLGSSVTTIGSQALRLPNLTTITVLADTPPTLDNEVFGNVSQTIPVYVPCDAVETYQNASWGGFSNFNGICGGVIVVEAEPAAGGTTTGAGTYEAGQYCTVTATANAGFAFANWTVDGDIISTNSEYTFPVYSDMTIVAHFVTDGNIVFADANVKSICVANWDANSDGELSYAEAASVTDLSNYFQYNSSITSFDELQYFIGLSTIGDNACYNCYGLTSIVLPNALTSIGNYALYGCYGLTSVVLPSSLTSIGNYAFYSCSGLTSIVLPSSLTTIGDYAFYYCSNIQSITSLALVPPTIMGYYTLNYCYNKPLYIPCGTLEAYQNAEYWSYFTNIQTELNDYFVQDGLRYEIISSNPPQVTLTGFAEGANSAENLVIPESIYSECSGLNYAVTQIAANAFNGCTGLTGNLVLPNTLVTIGDFAFTDCTGLDGELTIPESVTRIGMRGFVNCRFTTVHYNAINCESMGWDENHENIYYVFWLNSNLQDIIIGENVTQIPDYAFGSRNSQNCHLTFSGNAVTRIGDYAFVHDENDDLGLVGELIIPSSVTEIGKRAFYGCSGLTGDLIIPENMNSIGAHAFVECGFTSIHYNATNCESIGYDNDNNYWSFAFWNNKNIEEIVIGDNVTQIPAYAFANIETQYLLDLGNGLTTINSWAFNFSNASSSSGVKGTLVIPASVTSIYNGAFYGCSGLTEIWSKNTSAPWMQNSNVFYGADNTIPVHVPCGSISNYQSANYWSAFTNYSENPHVLVVKSNDEYLGNATVTQYGLCSNNGSIVHAEANLGGVFVNWTTPDGTFVSNNADYSFALTNDITLVANFMQLEGHHNFVGSGDWNDVDNWSPKELPTETSTVGIFGYAELYDNATVASATVYNDYYIYIGSDAALTVTGTLTTSDDSRVYLDEGGQLYHANDGVNAELWRTITPYTTGEADGWHLIASPLEEEVEVYEVENLTANEYDLYYYDEPTHYWMNQEDAGNEFNTLENAKGYLYGNNGIASYDTEIQLGEYYSTTSTIPMYTAYKYSISEQLFLASELTAAGVDTNPIKSISWYSNSNYKLNGISIWMANVDDAALTSTSHNTTNMQLVFTGGCTTTNNGWTEFEFNRGHFIWDGTSNVIVCVQKNGTPTSYSINWRRTNSLGFVASSDRYNGSTPYDMSSNTYSTYTYSYRTITRFKMENTSLPYEAQVGEGENTQLFLPMHSWWNYSISEQLFKAEELSEAGMGRVINSLSWYATAVGEVPTQYGISIWMANVSDTYLTTTSHNTSGMTLVYYGSFTPQVGWNEFAFNWDDFVWDGTSNVLVCVQRNNGDWKSGLNWQTHTTNFNASGYTANDNNAYYMSSNTYPTTVTTERANTLFKCVARDTTIAFTGEVKNGVASVNVPLSYTETAGNLKGFNLVGNPFAHNVTSYGSVNVANGCYIMNGAENDLIVSEISEENPLKPLEGFFVKATSADASITFNPQRGASMAKSNSIRIEVSKDNKLVDRLIVKDSEGQSLEKLNLNEKRTQVFAIQDQKEVSIVPCEGNEQPFSFKASKDGNYTINVDAEDMEFSYLHLIDNLTGNDVNLLIEPIYSFEAKTTDYASRFKLVFAFGSSEDPESDSFAFLNSSGNLTIYGIDGEATLQVLDVLGHVLSSEQFSGSYEKKLNVAPGVYMLRLIHGDDVKVQKIVVR